MSQDYTLQVHLPEFYSNLTIIHDKQSHTFIHLMLWNISKKSYSPCDYNGYFYPSSYIVEEKHFPSGRFKRIILF